MLFGISSSLSLLPAAPVAPQPSAAARVGARSAVARMQADATGDLERVLRENKELKQRLEESSSMRMRVTLPLSVVGAAGVAAGATSAGITVAPRILDALGVQDGVDEVEAFEKARAKMVDPRAEASMAKYFPGSLSSLATERLTSKVLVKRGYTTDNCLFATSTCPDEVNSKPEELIDLLKNRWGENFGLGGLGGVPFTGKAGFGAYSHHVPNGGKMFILFAPHVGVEYEGTVGALRRVNQDGVSSACGAAVGAFKALKAEMAAQATAVDGDDSSIYGVKSGTSDYFDAQINFIKAKLKQRLANYMSAPDAITYVTYQMYALVREFFIDEVLTAPGFWDYAEELTVLGGIMVNRGVGGDRFMPLMFQTRRQSPGTVVDLYEEAFGAPPDLYPALGNAISQDSIYGYKLENKLEKKNRAANPDDVTG